MANNGKSVATSQETAVATRQDTQTELTDEELTTKSRECMNMLSSVIDCPLTHMLLRNSVHMLLELPEHTFNVRAARQLLTDEKTRSDAVNSLVQGTPALWTNEWNSLWTKDIAPLLSLNQQRIAKRISLANFWSKEYANVPLEVRNRVASLLLSMS